MLSGFLRPSRQEALKNPEKWNADWETITQKLDQGGPSVFVRSAAVTLTLEPLIKDTWFTEHPVILRNLCRTQLGLTTDALMYFGAHDLEERWMKAGPDLREKHLLIGISKACFMSANLHDARMYCGPEWRLAHLRADGRTVLDLLKAVMLPAEEVVQWKTPDTPRLLSHPGWDAFAAAQATGSPTDIEKLTLARIIALRTEVTCHALHFTLSSFLGLPPPAVELTGYQSKKKHQNEPVEGYEFHRSFAERVFGPAGAKARAKDDKAASKELRSRDTYKQFCSYPPCSKVNENGAKLLRCKRCWETTQREILYCSAECQKADWKPHHKAICGKPHTFEGVSKPAPMVPLPPRQPQIGVAVGDYKRSPSLIYQVLKLNALPELDYIIRRVPGDETNLRLGDGEVRSLFRQCREKAMTTGDKESIAAMAHFICWMALEHPAASRPTAKAIVEQLKKEYQSDDLSRSVVEMQQKQDRDYYARPPLLAGMSWPHWVKYCLKVDATQELLAVCREDVDRRVILEV
ncbi:hypothetical protein B0H16DRAFT_1892419 [Mycena metata]|uniref:MYND-type domain-containing protein n=1 Tax=Mycena metata TaxID=1033252 RepID=A0AAD7MWA5_9AGAR|nr:hypothetical protein B0H16DRAFT_1892419 [Mycena metata]